MTYLKTVALGLDRFGAAVLFNRADITISSLCCVALNLQRTPSGFTIRGTPFEWDPDYIAVHAQRSLKLNGWQLALLRGIGRALNACFPEHCIRAVGGDIITAKSTIQLLT